MEKDSNQHSDLIRREDAITAVVDTIWPWVHGESYNAQDIAEFAIDKVPSAEPERAMKDCRNCKHGNYNDRWDTYFCYHSDDCNDWDKWEPSAELERDIPIKPIETTDKAWGIPSKQAVCPKCDYYLGHIAFLDDYKGKRITYCEVCGQAIDWEGWEFDE